MAGWLDDPPDDRVRTPSRYRQSANRLSRRKMNRILVRLQPVSFSGALNDQLNPPSRVVLTSTNRLPAGTRPVPPGSDGSDDDTS